MKFSLFNSTDTEEVITLFNDVFSASEGESEGSIIGNLVSNLVTKTKKDDLIGCVVRDGESIIGCIFFSRFIVPNGQCAFILSPVAISTGVQGSGIGQQLIHYGLDHLKSLRVDLVFTYGDPAFYSKTNFNQISENLIKAPFKLSQPAGWLAQSLDGKAVPAMQGATKCVEALSHQKYW